MTTGRIFMPNAGALSGPRSGKKMAFLVMYDSFEMERCQMRLAGRASAAHERLSMRRGTHGHGGIYRAFGGRASGFECRAIFLGALCDEPVL